MVNKLKIENGKLIIVGLLLAFSILNSQFSIGFASVLSDAITACTAGSFCQIPDASMTSWNNGNVLLVPDGLSVPPAPPGTSCGPGDYVTQYQNRIVWNAASNRIQFVGAPHGNCSQQRMKIFDGDSWSQGPTPMPSVTLQHSCDHNAITTSGDHYHRQFNSTTIYKLANGAGAWTTIPNIPQSSWQVCGTLEWFPDQSRLIWIDGDWGGWSYNPSTNSWTHLFMTVGNDGSGLPQYPMSDYFNWSVYSTQGVLVFGGGTNVYKMDAAGTVTTLATAPFVGVSGTSGNLTVGNGQDCCSVVADPISGRVIIITTNRHVWELNPAGLGTWTDTGRIAPTFFAAAGGTGESLLSASIPAYNAIFYVKCDDSADCNAYVYKHTLAAPDTTAPTAPSSLVVTAASASQINLTWTASTDNIGVTGYNVERCQGSGCSSFTQIYTPSTNSQSDISLTASTTYGYRVRAHDAAGNLSGYSSPIQYATTPASGGSGSDFATRCAMPSVLRCVSFDTDTDFNFGAGGFNGAYGQNFGYVPPSSTTDYSRILRDTSTKTSGASSLRLKIPGTSTSDSSGWWFTNFSSDLSQQVQEGQEIWVQWRFRVSPELLSQQYGKSTGFKIGWLATGGDRPECPNQPTPGSFYCPTTCWIGENVFTTDKRSLGHLLISYSNCQSNVNSQSGLYGTSPNFDNQNRGLPPATSQGCWYPTYTGPNCIVLTANEWWTVKGHIKVNQYSTWTNTVEIWIGREGQPLFKFIECSPTVQCSDFGTTGWYIANGLDAPTSGWNPATVLGKVVFSPYQTNGDHSGLLDAYIWYDDLIISRADIPDPGGGTIAPPSATRLTRRSM